jgi:hypothetical protein
MVTESAIFIGYLYSVVLRLCAACKVEACRFTIYLKKKSDNVV